MIDDQESILDGMRELFLGWDPPQLRPWTAERRYWSWRAASAAPTSSLQTITLRTDRPGLAAVDEVRAVFGSNIPGLIITADRSLEVLEIVRRRGLHLLKKPVKPAKLRLSRIFWRKAGAAPPHWNTLDPIS